MSRKIDLVSFDPRTKQEDIARYKGLIFQVAQRLRITPHDAHYKMLAMYAERPRSSGYALMCASKAWTSLVYEHSTRFAREQACKRK